MTEDAREGRNQHMSKNNDERFKNGNKASGFAIYYSIT